MQAPIDRGEDVGSGCQIRAGDRVDQPGARTLTPDLDQIGPLPVAVAGRALCVESHRSGPASDGPGRADELPLVHDHIRNAACWHVQEHQDRGNRKVGICHGDVL